MAFVWVRLEEILQGVTGGSFKLEDTVYIDDDGGVHFEYKDGYTPTLVTLMKDEPIRAMFKDLFFNTEFRLPLSNGLPDYNYFMALWGGYISRFTDRHDIGRLWYAFSLDYNPTWNVDGKEVRTMTHGETQSTVNIGARSDSVSTGERNDMIQSDEKAVNIDTPINVAVERSKTGAQSSMTSTGAQTNVSTTNRVIDVDEFIRGGNIGVTKTTDLLESEISFRLNTVVEMLVNQFVGEYGVSV